MSTASEVVEVVCPKCGEWFADWRSAAADPATTARCPECGFRLADDHSVWQEGVWLPDADEPDLSSL